MKKSKVGVYTAVVTLALALGACSSTESDTDKSDSGEIAFWDPYPQYEDGSDWDDHVKACAPDGKDIVRSSAPQTDLFNQLTTGVKEGTAPDVALLDNPMMPEAAEAGLLTDLDEVGLSAEGIDENLLGPGIVDGKTYGVPVGSNALALFYNKEILDDAGVDPEQISDWASLNSALEQVSDGGDTAITFAGVAGEEGVFQFLPWFWGSGADLSAPGSEGAVEAAQMLSDWIANGWAPKSATTDNQSNAWDLFLTGEVGFVENGSWFAADAEGAPFEVGVLPIPAKDDAVAPVPTGGEFFIVPPQESEDYSGAKEVIECLIHGDAALTTSETLGYLSAVQGVRDEQVAENELWEPWVGSVEGARGRTTDLGADYVNTSGDVSSALQTALNANGDEAAVREAFESME